MGQNCFECSLSLPYEPIFIFKITRIFFNSFSSSNHRTVTSHNPTVTADTTMTKTSAFPTKLHYFFHCIFGWKCGQSIMTSELAVAPYVTAHDPNVLNGFWCSYFSRLWNIVFHFPAADVSRGVLNRFCWGLARAGQNRDFRVALKLIKKLIRLHITFALSIFILLSEALKKYSAIKPQLYF